MKWEGKWKVWIYTDLTKSVSERYGTSRGARGEEEYLLVLRLDNTLLYLHTKNNEILEKEVEDAQKKNPRDRCPWGAGGAGP